MKNVTNNAGLKVRTNIRAGGMGANHNETQVRGLKVRTHIRAGGIVKGNDLLRASEILLGVHALG